MSGKKSALIKWRGFNYWDAFYPYFKSFYIYIYILIAFSFYRVKNIAWKSYNVFVKKTYYKQNEELHEKNIMFQYNLNYYFSCKNNNYFHIIT